ncbi:hypothetical protein NQ314_008369, partial [Rhamnusium bicolor]
IAIPKLTKDFPCIILKKGFKQIPIFIKKINDLKSQVNDLQENLGGSVSTVNVANNETLISEIHETQKRASNILILNIKESAGTTDAERNNEEKNSVREILKNIDVDI